MEISLQIAGAATHERQTQVAGKLRAAADDLEQMQALGLRVQLNSTLTAWNETEMEAMGALAEADGLALALERADYPRDNGDRAPLDIAASPQAISRLRELLEQRRGTETTIVSTRYPVEQILRRGCVRVDVVDPWGNDVSHVQWRVPAEQPASGECAGYLGAVAGVANGARPYRGACRHRQGENGGAAKILSGAGGSGQRRGSFL